MTRPLAAYTDIVDLDPTSGVRLLEEAGYEVRVLGTTDPDRIATEAAEASVLLCGYGAVTEQLMARLPRLRLVVTQSAGVDMVDLAAAERRGVWVANVPSAATEEVAGHTVAMALAMARGLPFLDRHVRAGEWDPTVERLRRFDAMTYGVLGFGRIGRRVAEMVRPLFGEVLAHDPAADRMRWPADVQRCTLDEVLERSDVVSLHLPLVDGPGGTAGLIGAERLRRMRRGAVLVNVSRGQLVDHEALLRVLDEGHLHGAALDVLPQEPPRPDDPVLHHPRVLVTPHAAYLSDGSAEAYVRVQAENAVAWLRSGEPLHPVVRAK